MWRPRSPSHRVGASPVGGGRSRSRCAGTAPGDGYGHPVSNLPPPPPQPGPQPFPGYQQQGYGYSYGAAPYQFAGFWARFAAAFLDGMIVGVPINFLVVAVPGGSSGIQLLG